MNQRTLLPQTEARRDGQHQCDGLYDQSPLSQVPTDNKATQNGLNLQELTIGYKGLKIISKNWQYNKPRVEEQLYFT